MAMKDGPSGPPAGGFGAQPGAQAGFEPAPALPPRPVRPRRPFAWYARLIVVITGVPALALVVAVIVKFERQKKRDLVVFDNRTRAPAEVSVDGKVVETVKPHEGFWIQPVVTLPEGAKKIVVTSNGRVVSEAELHIRPRRPDEAHGYRGLYVIGDAPDYVIARVPYYAGTPKDPVPPSLEALPRPSPLTELPRELESFEISSVDGPFSASESMPKGAKMVVKTQLCTLRAQGDDGADTIGCSGFAKGRGP